MNDESPNPATADEELCTVAGCDAPLAPYSGKGRRPTKCADHKNGRALASVKTAKSGGGKNANQAAQAAAVLTQVNSFIAMGLGAAGMMATASALAAASDGFEQAATDALLTDPALCRLLMRGGAMSGKAGLAMAYGMLAMAVAPVAVVELRARSAATVADADAA